MALDLPSIRGQFPILQQRVEGSPLIYLDWAATAQKPQAVIDRLRTFYEEENSNVHRSMHVLAERATVAFEDARKTVQKFINAARMEEIIFTKSCTEAINLVAKSWGRANLREGDVIVLSLLEHHSNVVPWLQLKEELGIEVKWVDIDDRGNLRMELFEEFLREGNVKLVAITGQSNVLGTRPDLPAIIRLARERGARVLIDAAQSIAHHQTDVRKLDCDFLAFSGHKLYGPTGVGVLYSKRELLESMPPFLGGGMMIREVHQDRFTSADIPAKFEAGTPPIAQAVGLAAAIEWLSKHSWKDIAAHERLVLSAAFQALQSVSGLRILGPTDPETISGCISFTIDGVHPHDLTEILGRQGICLRAGHHCTQPLHRRLGITASTRLSVGVPTSADDIRSCSEGISQAMKILLNLG